MNSFLQTLRTEIKSTWEIGLYKTSLWKSFNGADVDPATYASYLLETYHYTRQSPLIQVSTLAQCQHKYRFLIRPFLKHAHDEESHHRLCLHDLSQMGYDSGKLSKQNPLPNTEGYLGFIFNRIANVSPLSYIGYLYQLEFMAIEAGPVVIEGLLSSHRIPKSALSFLKVHAEDDVNHLAELDALVGQVESSADQQHIIYTAKTASLLYARMMDEAGKRVLL